MTLSFKQLFTLLVIASCVLFVASVLRAWTGPSASAPAANASQPINIGTTDQVKNAGLSINTLAVFGSSYVQSKVGVGTASPVVALDVAGALKIGNGGESCSSTYIGAIRYNSSSQVIQYCNGTEWCSMSGCTSTVVSFTTVGTTAWVVPSGVTSVSVLAVGGGGGSGGYGGGGGGGVVSNTSYAVTPSQSIAVVVGAGGGGHRFE